MHRVSINNNENLQPVLNRILFLSALFILEKYAAYFYEGGFFSEKKQIRLIRDTIVDLTSEIKDDAVALVDAIAPPDYVLNSILGNSDGNVYKNLYNSFTQSPGAFDRLDSYENFMDKKPFGHLKAKL
jgi:acyl-CoA oxidase